MVVINPLRCIYCDRHFPQRYLVTIFAFISIVLLYNMRIVLNLVINDMIPKPPPSNITGERCDVEEDSGGANATKKDDTGPEKQPWTESQQSFIRAAFYVGYVPAHIPAGVCADRFGARLLLLICMAVSSVFTLLIPVIVDYGGSWVMVGLTRILVGAGQGMVFPAVSSLVSFWIPKKERAFLGSFAMSGSHIGTVTGSSISGVLVAWKGWRLPFYVYGISGLAFMVPIFFWIFTSPPDNPYITDEEKNMLAEEIPKKVKMKIPLWPILKDRVVLAMSIGEFSHAWVFFTFNTDLPKYLSQMLGYDIQNNGFISALPSLGMWFCSIACGLLSDWLYKKKNIRAVTLRRWFTAVGCVIPGIFCVLAGYAGCNRTVAVMFLVLALTTKGPYYCGIKVNYLDITKNFSGIVFGLNNAAGAITGFITPYVLGIIAKNYLFSQWRTYFWISLIMCIIPTAIYWIMTDDKRRSWDYGEDETIPRDE